MRKTLISIMLICMAFSLVACGNKENEKSVNMEPNITQMQSICELAVMECYYHNVAKYYEEDATGV